MNVHLEIVIVWSSVANDSPVVRTLNKTSWQHYGMRDGEDIDAESVCFSYSILCFEHVHCCSG